MQHSWLPVQIGWYHTYSLSASMDCSEQAGCWDTPLWSGTLDLKFLSLWTSFTRRNWDETSDSCLTGAQNPPERGQLDLSRYSCVKYLMYPCSDEMAALSACCWCSRHALREWRCCYLLVLSDVKAGVTVQSSSSSPAQLLVAAKALG